MTINPYNSPQEQAFECNRQISEPGLAMNILGTVSDFDPRHHASSSSLVSVAINLYGPQYQAITVSR